VHHIGRESSEASWRQQAPGKIRPHSLDMKAVQALLYSCRCTDRGMPSHLPTFYGPNGVNIVSLGSLAAQLRAINI